MADKTLELIVSLAQRQVELEQKKAEMEQGLKDLNKEIEDIRGGYQAEGKLPAAMQEAELSEFTLADGRKIIVNKEMKLPSLAASSKHRQKVIDWLRNNGHKDLIKSELTAQFSQDADDKRLDGAKASLDDLGIPFECYESANAQSFKALINSLAEDGHEIPVDELGIMMFRQSEVKKGKS